jgi:peptidoglycan/LPS O-acetylase OafA/YrhL
MTESPQPAPARIPALDGFRGLAVLAVFAYHVALFSGATPRDAADRALAGALLHGWIGVDLFFVLSGFLITGILLDARGQPGALRRFYWRRVLRIVPAYYAILLAQLAILAWQGRGGEARLGWTATWLTNILIARQGWDRLVPTMHHFWSLAVEEQFYLLWPAVILLLPRRAIPWTCGALVIATSVVRVALVQHGLREASYVLLPARMDGLAVGAFLAGRVRGPDGVAGAARACRVPALLAALLLGGLLVWRGRLAYGDPYMLTFGLNALMLLAGCLLLLGVAQAERGPVGWLLRLRGLRLLGKYSYALYLWHQPIILWLVAAGFAAAAQAWVGGSLPLTLLLMGLVAGVCSLLVALLSWWLVESPMLRLKDRLR